MKKASFLCVCFLFFLAGVVEASENLIKNPGFEEDEIKPWAWQVSAEVDASGEKVVDVKHGGESSFYLQNKTAFGPNLYGALRQKVTGVLPGRKYKLSAWFRGEDVGRVYLGGGNDGWQFRLPIPFKYTDEWTELILEIETKENETAIEVVVVVESATKGLWVDDLSLVELPDDALEHKQEPTSN
jgi:hypothetical protein